MAATIKVGPDHKGEWIRVDHVEPEDTAAVVIAMAVELNKGEWPGWSE